MSALLGAEAQGKKGLPLDADFAAVSRLPLDADFAAVSRPSLFMHHLNISPTAIMHKTENVHFRKTNKNTVIKRVREVYLRTDIPCLSSQCPMNPPCHERVKVESSLLTSETPYYLIPDYSVSLRYVELLEQEELTNIIFSETILQRLQSEDKSRTYKSLRQVAKDPRRRSVVFCNEHCEDTHVEREPNESIEHRDWRALLKSALWYYSHLQRQVPIILLSEQFSQADAAEYFEIEGITVLSAKQYLNQYWPNNSVLHELFDSLKEAILEEDVKNQTQESGALRKSSSTGYQEYKPLSELEAGVKSERFFQGVLKVRANHRDQAFIRGNANIGEIVIMGSEYRNRAVHGDVVVVELLNKASWVAPSTHISYDPEEVHAAADDNDEERSTGRRHREIKPTGRVVGVLTRNWQPYVATLQEGSEKDSGSFHLVLPLSPIIPKIRIRHHDPKVLANQRIVVRIDSWPTNSQYPNGHYVRSIGPVHELDTEISAILIEHGISVSQTTQGFSEGSLKEMPVNTDENPWKPDSKELSRRRDLRKHTVFSIDPPNCQDIDDAISIRELENGKIEFGVHIADVSFFVKENSLTDLEARSRGTTVYLSDRRFDMLPKVLSEQICSLRHHVDRYAMSVMWTLDSEANVLDSWFGRTVIRSACEMEYEQAQGLLNGKDVVPNLDAKTCKQLKPSVVLLAKTMRKVRARRMANGGLELESSEVKFKFKEEGGGITDILPKQPLEVHQIIEEAMVMANSHVAKRIYTGFRDSSMLRHHPPPIESHFKMLIRAAESRGFTIDTSSNLSLANSLRECAAKSQGDIEFVRLIKTMATMAMSEASYMSSGSCPVNEYAHYGLALDFYTHFTSPIRRYADLVVHRQLTACVEGELLSNKTTALSAPSSTVSSLAHSELLKNGFKMEQLAEHLNYKNRESKFAQKDSTELFQTLFILQRTRRQSEGTGLGSAGKDGDEEEVPYVEAGIISEIRENGFFVFVPRLGIKGPVYLKEKSGDVVVPLSVLKSLTKGTKDKGELQQQSKEHLVNVSGCEMDTDLMTKISISVPATVAREYTSDKDGGLARNVQFRLFDKVQVALRLKKSLAHRHSIYMTLIGLEPPKSTADGLTLPSTNRLFKQKGSVGQQLKQDEVKRIAQQDPGLAKLSERELIQQIRQGQEEATTSLKYTKSNKKKAGKKQPDPEEMYSQTRAESSLYRLMDAFDRFRIIESSETEV
ncbi:DIS3 mitotic control [Lunasporangiospora selenospora]|uniref:DIS3-like exonuclease 1 n=1 Tax=Lunasporangiospora selenospora TaxID=979761 RepID=A0A9P6FZN2_9FUNG|nr:DIS3 mitotic control [Lunasporangiospora selenospora]